MSMRAPVWARDPAPAAYRSVPGGRQHPCGVRRKADARLILRATWLAGPWTRQATAGLDLSRWRFDHAHRSACTGGSWGRSRQETSAELTEPCSGRLRETGSDASKKMGSAPDRFPAAGGARLPSRPPVWSRNRRFSKETGERVDLAAAEFVSPVMDLGLHACPLAAQIVDQSGGPGPRPDGVPAPGGHEHRATR